MSAINQKSISGITSITTPTGVDDVFTIHSGDTTERFRVDQSGNQNISGIVTATNFKSGSSNLHSTGLTVGDTFVHSTGVNGSSADIDDFVSVGSNIHLGNAGVITATTFKGDGDFVELDVDGHTNLDNVSIAGVVTATAYHGDGSDLTNLPAGLGTALSATASSPLNKMYYTNQVLGVPSSVTVDVPTSASKAYTQYADIKVESSADLIIAEGDDLIPDVLGLADFGTFGGGASAGRIRVNSITNAAANGATTIQNGVVISGMTTITGGLSIGGTITYEDVTNIDSIGIITARSGVDVDDFVSVGSNIHLGNAGVVTATSFVGSGANLTSLPAQATISNNADDRVITGGSGVNLNGESNMTYTSNLLKLSTPSSTSTDAELLHLVGGGTSNRGLKISTGRASGASQNHAAAIYDAINSESSGYGSQHRFKIAGTDCFTIGYNGDFGYVGINDNVPYPDSVGGNTVNTCLELGSPSGTDTSSVIKFIGRDGSGNANKCQIQWAGANNRFDITVNGNQALQIQPNKDVEVTDGNLVIGTSGHGISFAADGNASGMSNELLDDYEEGSWSALPSTGGTFTGCRYVKIGNMCLVTGSVSNLPTHSGSNIEIYGLPFNNRNSGALGQVTYIGALRGYNMGSNAGNSRPPTTIVLENSRIYVGTSYGNGGWDLLQYNEMGSSSNAIQFNVVYQTA